MAGLDESASVQLLDRLRAMGYRPERIQGDGAGSDVALALPLSVRFAEGHRAEALCVAGDLGLDPDAATLESDLPAAITLMAGKP